MKVEKCGIDRGRVKEKGGYLSLNVTTEMNKLKKKKHGSKRNKVTGIL